MRCYSKFCFGHTSAFTLAEMMVVLLIASIVLACMAPAITTRVKADKSSHLSSPWKWAQNSTDAYFGINDNQMAMIGQSERADTDSSKLIINNSANLDDMILFKNGENTLGHLRFPNNGILFGSGENIFGNNVIAIGENVNGGYGSIAIGSNIMKNIEDSPVREPHYGENNVAIGQNALENTTSGTSNIGIGSNALQSNTSGGGNIAIGTESLTNNTEGNYNIAIGEASLINNTKGYRNIAIGPRALNRNTEGNYNIAIGQDSLYIYAKSSYNTAIGYEALHGEYNFARGEGNTAVGYQTLYKNAGDYNTALGYQAMGDDKDATYTGKKNVAIGYQAALKSKGSDNIAIGANALNENEKGMNVAIGTNTISGDGQKNVAIGYEAINGSGGDHNVAIGYRALSKGGSRNYGNVAIGYEAAYNTNGNRSYEHPNYNIAIGYQALFNNVTGGDNIAIGYRACENVKGSHKICIGQASGPNASDTLAQDTDITQAIFLGTLSTTTYIPGKLNVDGEVSVRGSVVHSSDRRLKNVGKENLDGLAKLRKIKVFNYTFKKDETKTPQVGVMAQDLQKIFPNAVKKGVDGFLTIRMEDMFYAVINAVKELDSRVTRLEKENKELRARLEKLEAKMK